jgi:outer membrane protein assembly factor BamB
MCRLSILLVHVVSFFAATALAAAAADNWPQWRGPDADGVAPAGDYPVEFSADHGVAWQVALPGRGTSTPAVWDDRIFVTCGADGQDTVVCYDMSGHELWRQQLGPERAGKHPNGSGSNPSPVTDGRHVVVYFKSGSLACFDVDGKQLWRVNLQDRYGPDTLWWDLGTSPVLAGDRVIVAVLQAGDSYLVALDVASGEVLWKQPRQYQCANESDQAYTTPHVVPIDGRDVIVTWGADHLTGHALDSGQLLWECGAFNPDGKGNWRAIASPAISGDLAIVPYGRGDFLAAVRLGGSGDVTATNRVWEKQGLGGDVPSPVVRDGRVVLLSDSGRLWCVDAQSGNELWSAALPKSRHRFYASPVLAGDLLYSAREDGTLFVGRITDEGYTPLAANEMGESIIATPIPIRDGLLVRGEEHLFRIASARD